MNPIATTEVPTEPTPLAGPTVNVKSLSDKRNTFMVEMRKEDRYNFNQLISS
jgi:hypothetical protein